MATSRQILINSLALILSCGYAGAHDADQPDLVAMRAAAKSYADAWLTNDPDKVMATFVADLVLSPSGLPFVEGREAARHFWFPPDSPPTRVTEFELSEIESAASGNLGFVRGTFHLAFEYDGESYANQGKYLTILSKDTDGSWRISHHFWDDLPQVN